MWIGGGAGWAVAGGIVMVITVNAVNFMDGVDGITGLTVGLWGVTALVVAGTHGSSRLMPLAAVTAGAAIGFLPANLPHARLFLGDVGSYLLGALVGAGLLVGWADRLPIAVLVAPLAVYLADTGYTLLRRARRGANVLVAHREHVYQRLVSEVGVSHAGVAGFATVIAALVTVSWVPGNTSLGIVSTAALLSTYLCSVRLAKALQHLLATPRSMP